MRPGLLHLFFFLENGIKFWLLPEYTTSTSLNYRLFFVHGTWWVGEMNAQRICIGLEDVGGYG
jgi:hypothetical protein